MQSDSITIRNNLIGSVEVTKENYNEVLDRWRAAVGNESVPDLEVMAQLGLCPISLVTAFSREAMRVYRATDGGNRVKTPDEYYSLPAVYLQVCDIIRAEEYKLMEQEERRRGNQHRKT